MASKLLNVRMEEEMLNDLKEVCLELNISVTDAIKTFSKKLIKDRKLNGEEEEILKNKNIKDILFDEVDTCGKEEHEKLNEFIGETINNYFCELREIVRGYEITSDVPNRIEKTRIAVNEFKEKNGEELKNKITDKISEFFIDYARRMYEDILNSTKEYEEEVMRAMASKYEDIMNILKKENKELYNKLIDDYSIDLNLFEIYSMGCKTYIEAKIRLEKLMTKEEMKEFIEYKKMLKKIKIKNEEKKYIDKIKEENYDRYKNLKIAIAKFEAEQNGGEYISEEELKEIMNYGAEQISEEGLK